MVDKIFTPFMNMFPTAYGLNQSLNDEEYKSQNEALGWGGLTGLYKFHHKRNIGQSEYHDLLEEKLPEKKEEVKQDDEQEIIAQRERNRQPKPQNQEQISNRNQYQRLPQQDDEEQDQQAKQQIEEIRQIQPPSQQQIQQQQQSRLDQIRNRQEQIDNNRQNQRLGVREYLPNLSRNELNMVDRGILAITGFLSQSKPTKIEIINNNNGQEFIPAQEWTRWSEQEKKDVIDFMDKAEEPKKGCRRIVGYDADGKMTSFMICTGQEGIKQEL